MTKELSKKDNLTDDLAILSSLLLYKFGNDYSEWRDLKDILLKIHPHLGPIAKDRVGGRCSEYNETLRSMGIFLKK